MGSPALYPTLSRSQDHACHFDKLLRLLSTWLLSIPTSSTYGKEWIKTGFSACVDGISVVNSGVYSDQDRQS